MLPRTLWIAIGILGLASPVTADMRTYDAFSFRRSQLEKRLVVLDFHSKWCPICRSQSPLLEKVLTQKRFVDVIGYLVDFKKDTNVARQFGVRFQNTVLVLFQGKEVERVTGEIRHEDLQEAVANALTKASQAIKKPGL